MVDITRENEVVTDLLYYKSQDDDNQERREYAKLALADLQTYANNNGRHVDRQMAAILTLGARAMYDVMKGKEAEGNTYDKSEDSATDVGNY